MKILILFLAVALTACGGGGGATNSGGSTPPGGGGVVVTTPPEQPVVETSTEAKSITVSWALVAGVTYYRVFVNADGHSGFMNISGDLSASTTSYTVSVNVAEWNWQEALFVVEACNSAGCTDSATEGTSTLFPNTAISRIIMPGSARLAKFGNAFALSGDGNTLVATSLDANSCATLFIGSRVGGNVSFLTQIKPTTAYRCAETFKPLAITHNGKLLAFVQPEVPSELGAVTRYLYTYYFDGSSWQLGAKSVVSDLQVTISQNGSSIAIFGNGNYVADLNANGTHGTFRTVLPISHPLFATGRLGASVDFDASGNTMIVGAPTTWHREVIGGDANPSGVAYIFEKVSGVWTQRATIGYSDYIRVNRSLLTTNDFGNIVELSDDGSMAFIRGKTMNSSFAYTAPGIHVYAKPTTGWTDVFTPADNFILPVSSEALDDFGLYMQANSDGSALLVSARGDDSNSVGLNGDETNNLATNSGAAYMYRKTGSVWNKTAYLKAGVSTENSSSRAVMSSDTSAIVLSSQLETWNVLYEGAMYIF